MWAKIINDYYKLGLYTADQVKVFVAAKWITAEQYQQITGEMYQA